MNETNVFKDGYRAIFEEQDDFFSCLKRIGNNSFWKRRKAKNLRLVAITEGSPIAEEMREKYVKDGLDEDIILDTIVNTGLLLKDKSEYYPVRGCAMKLMIWMKMNIKR